VSACSEVWDEGTDEGLRVDDTWEGIRMGEARGRKCAARTEWAQRKFRKILGMLVAFWAWDLDGCQSMVCTGFGRVSGLTVLVPWSIGALLPTTLFQSAAAARVVVGCG
jgi:hypothetical protein